MRKQCILVCLFLCLGSFQLYLQAAEPMKNNSEKDHCPELTGRVILPNQPEYDKARLVSNFYASKDKHPDVIVYCKTEKDIQNAVKWARCQKKSIRVRSGGHNHEAFSTGTGVIVIDVSEMKKLDVDKSQNIITIQPGITGGELYRQLYEVGLTQVGGTCSDVGLSGLVLSGGMGPLLRKHGLTCDNLLSLEMVDASGTIITATADNEHKDLFWACRGGGAGNFGVVTSMRLKVYPAEKVVWFNIGWDWNQPLEEVINAWQDFFAKPDERWFSHLDIWAKPFPSEKFKQQPLKVLGVFWGTPEEARKELEPILSIGHPNTQVIETVDWVKAIKEFEDATAVFITDKPEYKSSGAFAMQKLPIEATSIITETLKNTSSPLLNVLLFSMGGASQKVAPTDTAYFYRDAKFFISYSTQWLQENEDVKQTKELDALRQKLLPYAKGDYIGNPDRSFKDYLTEYYGENVRRLRCVKRKYDPENIFQYEQSIPPAPSDWNCEQKT